MFNAVKPAYSVVSVDNIIPRIQYGKIRNFIAFFTPVQRLFAAFSLASEYFSVADYRRADERIFKDAAYRAAANDNSAPLGQCGRHTLIRRNNSVILKPELHIFCTLGRSCQDYRPILIILIIFKGIFKKLCISVKSRQGSRFYVIASLGLYLVSVMRKRAELDKTPHQQFFKRGCFILGVLSARLRSVTRLIH